MPRKPNPVKTVPRTFRTPQPIAKRLAAFVKSANKKHPGLSKPKVSQTSVYLASLEAYLFQHGF